MSDPIEYEHRETVLAEKVEDGGTVVTIHGVRTANPGDYILYLRALKKVWEEDDEGNRVEVEKLEVVGCDLVDGGEFETNYAPKEKAETPEKAPVKRAVPPRKAAAK